MGFSVYWRIGAYSVLLHDVILQGTRACGTLTLRVLVRTIDALGHF